MAERYRTYLKWHDSGAMDEAGYHDSADAALTAFQAMATRRELVGKRCTVVLIAPREADLRPVRLRMDHPISDRDLAPEGWPDIAAPQTGMTPAELKAARESLGLSAEGFAGLVRVASGRVVRRWEAGDRDIPGPVQVIVEALLASPAVREHFGVTLQGEPDP